VGPRGFFLMGGGGFLGGVWDFSFWVVWPFWVLGPPPPLHKVLNQSINQTVWRIWVNT